MADVAEEDDVVEGVVGVGTAGVAVGGADVADW